MRLLLILFLVLAASCTRKQPEQEVLAVAKNPPDTIPFKAFNYDYRFYYIDSIAGSITPDRQYQYWAYISGHPMNTKFKGGLPITKEEGDTLLCSKIIVPRGEGFFKGGQFSTRSDYVAIVAHDSLRFITTNAGFRDFLGTIDNVDEAVLLAFTFYYGPEYGNKDGDYRVVNGNYEMHLRLFDPFPSCIPTIDPDAYKTVTVTKDGFIKVVARQKNNEANKAP